jgi:uncharacterized paraquat-inducible protein A
MANGESNIRLVLTPLLKLFIGVVVLLAIGTIINALPMVKEIPATDLPVPISEIVKVVIATLILVLLINFAFEFGDNLQEVVPTFPELGIISRWIVFLITIIVAFVSYNNVAQIFLGEQKWIYSLFFVAIALVPIVSLLILFYRHVAQITDLIVSGTENMGRSRRRSTVVSPTQSISKCPHCGNGVAPGAKFCRSCGERIPEQQPATQSPIPNVTTCPECGVSLSNNAKFCSGCGSRVAGEA